MRVVPFDDERCRDVARAGGKGASLARMAALGLPVPPGFVVPASCLADGLPDGGAALRALLADRAPRRRAGRGGAGARREVEPAAELRASIEASYAALGGDGDAPVAVRSSACAEDSETASFAGQQETYLHVRGADAVLRRIRDCWASFFTERALFYRSRKGALDDLGMAVVVQRMVDADVAGVLFTIDPTRGRRDRMLVEAVFGLGEAVVSGEVTPDHYVLARDGRLKRSRLTTQPYAVVRDPDGGTREEPLPEERGAAQTLDEDQLAQLAASAAISRSGSAARRTSSGRSRAASCSCSRRGPSPPELGGERAELARRADAAAQRALHEAAPGARGVLAGEVERSDRGREHVVVAGLRREPVGAVGGERPLVVAPRREDRGAAGELEVAPRRATRSSHSPGPSATRSPSSAPGDPAKQFSTGATAPPRSVAVQHQ